ARSVQKVASATEPRSESSYLFSRPSRSRPKLSSYPRMTLKRLLLILLLFTACAPLGSVPSDSWERRELWDEAHGYFATRDYERADSVFQLLAREYPHTNEGRESLFYLGAIHLDARNPGFDPKPAEEWLE